MRLFYQEKAQFSGSIYTSDDLTVFGSLDPLEAELSRHMEDILPSALFASPKIEFEVQTLKTIFTAMFKPSELVKRTCLYPIVASSQIQSTTHFTHRSGWLCYQLCYTFEGHGILHFGNQTYHLNPGSFFLIDCNAPHYYYTDDPNSWGYSLIHFAGTAMEYLFPEVTKNGYCFPDQERTRAYRRYEKLLLLIKEMPENFDLQFHCLLNELLLELSVNNTLSKQEIIPEWLSAVLAHITQNFNQDLRLEELAGMVYLSPGRFSHKFKAFMKVSPIEYQYRLRISRACELLKYTDHTITQIASKVGFHNENNFYIKFRSATGMPPGQYRIENRF